MVTSVHRFTINIHANNLDQWTGISRLNNKNPNEILEISRDLEKSDYETRQIGGRSEYISPPPFGEARDSSAHSDPDTRAIQAADSRNTRHPHSNESASSRPLPSFPSSPVTFPPGMTRLRALDSVPWHYVVPHLSADRSLRPPLSPNRVGKSRFPRVVIKAAAFHVTSYLDLWRLFLASGENIFYFSNVSIDSMRGWINWKDRCITRWDFRFSALGSVTL